MSNVLRISEAASLALHAAVFLAANPGKPISTREIASALEVSEAHLSKVMQRLARTGLVNSVRGPKGGFLLARSPARISLLEVYEAIEGRLLPANCLLGTPVCKGEGCILGDLVETLNGQVREYLSRTRLSELVGVYGGINERS